MSVYIIWRQEIRSQFSKMKSKAKKKKKKDNSDKDRLQAILIHYQRGGRGSGIQWVTIMFNKSSATNLVETAHPVQLPIIQV